MKKSALSLAILLLFGCSAEEPTVAKIELPGIGSSGAALLLANCTQCHGAPNPVNHKAEEWAAVVRRMQNWRTTKGFVAIPKEDEAQIVSYLKEYAGK